MDSRVEVTSVDGCYTDLQRNSQQTTGMHLADFVSLLHGIIDME